MKKIFVLRANPIAAPVSNLPTDVPVVIYGIELSFQNGTVDWAQIKKNSTPVSFAYIKCTHGSFMIDPKCAEHSNGAIGAKIRFGYYHVATLNSSDIISGATAEAKAFDAAMNIMPPCRLMPALHLETNDKHLSPAEVELWISTFLSVMNSLGRKNIMLYSNRGFFDSHLTAKHPFGNLPLWHSQSNASTIPHLPRGWNKYTIWQFSETGKVDGIGTNCDLSKSTSDFLALPG
jgi:lysozyme